MSTSGQGEAHADAATEPPTETELDEDIPTLGVAELALNEPQEPYKLNLGHQEIDRILHEIEDYCESVIQSGGTDAWMPITGFEKLLIVDLGYEDVDSFQDALGGTFEQFLGALPHFELMVQDDGGSCDGQTMVRMVPPPPVAERRPFELHLTVRRSEDLWRTLMKSPPASICIPALEFESGASERRQTDSVYNHITHACFNLGMHARQVDATTAGAPTGWHLPSAAYSEPQVAPPCPAGMSCARSRAPGQTPAAPSCSALTCRARGTRGARSAQGSAAPNSSM